MSKNKKKKLCIAKILLFLFLIIGLIFGIKYFNKKDANSNSTLSNNAQNTNTTEAQIETTPVKVSPVSTLTEEEIEQSKKRGLPVLMYHFFYDEQAGEKTTNNNYMEIHDFEEQIKYLAENDYYVPTWEEVLGYINGKNGLPLKSVVITVDDGDASFFKLAVPILEKYNFQATSFLIASWYEGQLENYVSSNVDFQSHSYNMHKSGSNGKGAFLTLSYEKACEDLELSRSIIGEDCKVFCYPFGHFDDNCKKTLTDCNFILAFTTQGGRVFPGNDPLELPRVRTSLGDSLNSFINKVK